MRKQIALLIVLLVCIDTIKTEAINEKANVSIYNPTRKLGIYCGPTLNSLVGDKHSKKDANISGKGFHVYSFYTCFLKPYLDLELTFGYHLKSLELGPTFRSNAFHYLKLTPQLHIFPGDDRQFFIVLGAYAGYLLGAQVHLKSYFKRYSLPTQHHSRDIEKAKFLNHCDVGMVSGLGYQFKIGLILKLNTSIGFRNIFDTPYDITNRFISTDYSLGYNFGKLFE